VTSVVDDKKRGLVAKVAGNGASQGDVANVLNDFTGAWDLV